MAEFRARDVRRLIKEFGFEEGMMKSLELLADEMAGLRQSQNEIVQIQSQVIDQLTNVVNSAGAIATQMNEMKRKEEQFDEHRGEGIVSSRN